MQKSNPKKEIRRPQRQNKPGDQFKMKPEPVSDKMESGKGKLAGKVAIITGGDSGIGKAVAILFAKEGADIAIIYLNEHKDAKDTQKIIREYNQKCTIIPGDLSKENFCTKAVREVIKDYGKVDILVNNAGTQVEQKSILDITTKQLISTFATNIFSFFWMTKASLPFMKRGGAIINSTSVTAYRGSAELIDYSSSKGAIVSFTRSLAQSLVEKGIRVNAVAPGPIWTPLIVSSFPPKKVAKHGSDAPMKRAGEPAEVAPSYLFLAAEQMSSYITGQVIHPNGGEIVNG